MEFNKLSVIFAILILSSKGYSAPDNLRQLNLMDLNQNDEITLKEFNLGMQNRFKLLDTNNDGTITEDEFLNPTKLRFNRLDLNSDNVLKKKEIRKAIRKMKRQEKSNQVGKKKKPKPFIKQ